MCRVLRVSRSGYLQWRSRAPSARARADAALDAQVAAVHAASGRAYGRARVQRELAAQGVVVGHERVRRSLRRQGLSSVHRRAYKVTTDSAHGLPVAANVLARRFDGWAPQRAWSADITYLATAEGWLYLAVVLDLATRQVVGWSMCERMTADLVCDALRMALWRRRPPRGVIAHSDRGAQYASGQYRRLLKDHGFVQSMSRRANCWDNAPVESFFKSLKTERVYQVSYPTRAQAKTDVMDWIEAFYNRRRLHSAVGWQTPEAAWQAMQAA